MLEGGRRPEGIVLASARVQSAQTTKDHACKRYEEAAQMRAVRHAKAKATIQKAEERLEYARNDLERLKTLFLEGVIPKRELEGAEDLVSLRQKEKEEAQAEIDMVLADNLTEMRKEVAVAEEGLRETEAGLKLLLSGSRREEIEAAQAEIARLEAQQDYLQKQIQHLDVRT